MFQVIETDLLLKPLIENDSVKLSVLSSHKKALNLLTEFKELISLVLKPIPCGPGRAVVFDNGAFPTIPKDCTFYLKDKILYDESGLFLFDFSKTLFWEERLSLLPTETNDFINMLKKSFAVMMPFCKEREKAFFIACRELVFYEKCCNEIDDPVYSRLFYNLVLFLSDLKKEKVNKESVKKFVINLLGLGYGLTPSGDDIISGLLNSFNIILKYSGCNPGFVNDFADVLSYYVLSSLQRTVAVSASFLSLSAKGRIPQEVLNYYNACVTGDETELYKAISYFVQHGDSSGRELFMGLFIGFYALLAK